MTGPLLPDRDPLERDLLDVEDMLEPEEDAMHVEPDPDDWIEGRDLSSEEIQRAHDIEVRRLERYLHSGLEGGAVE